LHLCNFDPPVRRRVFLLVRQSWREAPLSALFRRRTGRPGLPLDFPSIPDRWRFFNSAFWGM
jgi:hypothetical protein